MSADSTILAGRRMMENLMEAAGTVRRVTGTTVDATGRNVPITSVIYSGKCRVKYKFARVTEVTSAGQTLAEQRPEVSFPVATSGSIQVDDILTIDSNPLDPALVGAQFRIAGVHAQTQATARRFLVVVIS
jgi:hypothetical protein